MLTIQTYQSRTRKPSVELLESVRLRPTYYSFPQFNYDQSPNVPSFRFPQYSLYSLKEPSLQSPSSNSVINRSSPKSSGGGGEKQPESGKTSMFGTVVNCSNFFFGVTVTYLIYVNHLNSIDLSDRNNCTTFCFETVRLGGSGNFTGSRSCHVSYRSTSWQVPAALLS